MFPGDEDIRLFTDSIEDAEEYLSAALEEKQAEEQFMKLFSQIGIDQNELENLYQHMSALEKKDPQFSDKLLALSDRLLDLPSFTSISELSAGEIAELLDVMNDFQDTLQVKTKFYLINGNSKKNLQPGACCLSTRPKGPSFWLNSMTGTENSCLTLFLRRTW